MLSVPPLFHRVSDISSKGDSAGSRCPVSSDVRRPSQPRSIGSEHASEGMPGEPAGLPDLPLEKKPLAAAAGEPFLTSVDSAGLDGVTLALKVQSSRRPLVGLGFSDAISNANRPRKSRNQSAPQFGCLCTGCSCPKSGSNLLPLQQTGITGVLTRSDSRR